MKQRITAMLKKMLIIGAILMVAILFILRIERGQQASEIPTAHIVTTPKPASSRTTELSTLAFVTLTALPPDHPTHVAETLTAMPTIPPTATSTLAPPQCTFPFAQTIDVESKPQSYNFSEPQIVLTDELQPDIISWLPDNQNVLIMSLRLIDLGMNGYQQIIELFNPETQETRIFATRRKVEEAPPAWNPALNAIVYPDMKVLEGSTITDFRFTRQVRISYGNPDDTRLLVDNLPQYPIAVKPDGSQIAYLLDKQLFKLDDALKHLAPISFDRKRWDYLHGNDNTIEVYKMVWRPNSAHIFLYNHAIDGLGYTYILDTDNGRICNLSFDGWARAAQWSPNGRYLAIIRAQGAVPIRSSDVAVLDTKTGGYYMFRVNDLEIKEGFVQDVAWAPDNRHLLFNVETTYLQSTHTYGGLWYLGDFISGQVEPIFSSYQINIDAGSTNLAWSPDGSKLLINCPTVEGIKQVCLISVQISGK